MEEILHNRLGESVEDYDPSELPVYQPLGENGVWSDLERPRAIDEGVVRAMSPVPEIDPLMPTNSERLRLLAIHEKKVALRRMKHLKYMAGRPDPKAERARRKQKRATAERQKLARKKLSREANVEKYWNTRFFEGEWSSARLRAELNGVEWGITEEEWEESGIDGVIGDVSTPRLRRYDPKLPWTLDNLMVEDGMGKVIWDGVENRMRKLGYIV